MLFAWPTVRTKSTSFRQIQDNIYTIARQKRLVDK